MPIGLIRLTSVTTGSCEPLAYITLTDAVKSVAIERSTCAFTCQVCATWKSESTAHGDCWLSVPVPAAAGNAGAPAEVGLKV